MTEPSPDSEDPRTSDGRPIASADRVGAKLSAAKTAKANRRREIATLHLARVPQREIARRLGLTECTVSRDLSRIRGEWLQEAKLDIESMTVREVAALDADEAALRARLAEISSDELKLKFYDRLLRISERRAKLLGLEAPARTQIVGAGGGPLGVAHAHMDLTQLFLKDPVAADLGIKLVQRLDAENAGRVASDDSLGLPAPSDALAP